MPCASCGRPCSITWVSAAISSAMRSINHGSYWATAQTSATVKPSRSACAAISSRSGERMASAASISSRGAPASLSTLLKPLRPVSSPRSAFCIDSWMLRPIAMTSPTDFIAVPSVASAPLNFSKAKRGILVTT
jgi:hypothetical protein